MYVQGTTKASSLSHCCRGKAISIKYSECVSVTLVIQHAKRIYLIILSYYLINETIFEKKRDIEYKMRVFISLQLLSETFLSPSRIQRDIIINVHVKYLLLLSDFGAAIAQSV